MPNKLLFPEEFDLHVLFLFHPFRDEKELLLGFPLISQNKLPEQGVQDVVNISKTKFEPCGDLVDRTFLQFNQNLIDNQGPYSQTENDETVGAKYSNKSDSEEGETNKTFALPTFMSQIIPDYEITEGINSLNPKQK